MNPTVDIEAALRSLDPEQGIDDTAHLAALRARVERACPPACSRTSRHHSTGRRRTVTGLAVAAVAVPVLVAGRSLLPAPSFDPQLAAASVGVHGQLTCDGHGDADPIKPADAPRRLLPTLPPGWSLTGIAARASTGSDACSSPSLVAVATDAGGLVTGTLSVTGPVHADLGAGSLGARSQDVVDGHPARVFTMDADVPFERWLWTDGAGQQWQAEVSGYSPSVTRSVMAAVATSGTQVSFGQAAASAATGAPPLRVEQRRTGAPYVASVPGLDWYLDLSDGARVRQVEVRHATGTGNAVRTDLAQYAVVGAREATLDGRSALVLPTASGDDADGDGRLDPAQTPVLLQVDAATLAWGWAMGDLPATEALLTSLADVAKDDPRLAQ